MMKIIQEICQLIFYLVVNSSCLQAGTNVQHRSIELENSSCSIASCRVHIPHHSPHSAAVVGQDLRPVVTS